MTRALLVTLILIALSPASQRSREDPALNLIRGAWIIQGAYYTYGPSALDQDQVDALRGRRVVYSKQTIEFDRQILKDPHYSFEVRSPTWLVQAFHATCRQLGVCGRQITLVDAESSTDPDSAFPGLPVIPIDRFHLAAYDQGVFLKLVRTGAKP